MSTLWTPSGEHEVNRTGGDAPGTPATAPQTVGTTGTTGPPTGTPTGPTTAGSGGPTPPTPGGGGEDGTDRTAASGAQAGGPGEEIESLRQELARTPAEQVVANHCYGLFELATIYLSLEPPSLPKAQLAIDALGALVDTLGGRLGEAHAPLSEALTQIRLAFVRLSPSPGTSPSATPPGPRVAGDPS